MVSLCLSHCHSVSLIFIPRSYFLAFSITPRRTSSSCFRSSLSCLISSCDARRTTFGSAALGAASSVEQPVEQPLPQDNDRALKPR